MPHQCTNCGREFPDGSKEMLSGCPDCGSNKFQFVPSGGTDESAESDPEPDSDEDSEDYSFGEWPETAKRPVEKDSVPASDDATETDHTTPDSTAETDHTTAGDTVSGESVDQFSPDGSAGDPSSSGSAAETTPADAVDETGDAEIEEDAAQASARTEMVSTEELPETSPDSVPTDPTTDFDRLREELNDQFESIRIVSPGTYELNLMELYDRQEYIISLREDGRYVIEMPDAWDSPEE